MNKDELLAKLLDGALSAAEKEDLESLMASSPDFTEEVRELLVVEDLLKKPETAESLKTYPFLRSMENRIAAIIAGAGTASVATSIGSSVSGQGIAATMSTGLKVFLSALLTTGIVGTAAFVLWPDDGEKAPSTMIAEQQSAEDALSETDISPKGLSPLEERTDGMAGEPGGIYSSPEPTRASSAPAATDADRTRVNPQTDVSTTIDGTPMREMQNAPPQQPVVESRRGQGAAQDPPDDSTVQMINDLAARTDRQRRLGQYRRRSDRRQAPRHAVPAIGQRISQSEPEISAACTVAGAPRRYQTN